MKRIDSWHISVLPRTGALTDTWKHGWVYLAITKCTNQMERGFLFDVNQAATRAAAIERGHAELLKQRNESVIEEWAYTTAESKYMDFKIFLGGARSSEQSGCGCGEDD